MNHLRVGAREEAAEVTVATSLGLGFGLLLRRVGAEHGASDVVDEGSADASDDDVLRRGGQKPQVPQAVSLEEGCAHLHLDAASCVGGLGRTIRRRRRGVVTPGSRNGTTDGRAGDGGEREHTFPQW